MSNADIEEHFNINFLKLVACELRFPPFLNIEKKIPDFQENIRDFLPSYGLRKKVFDLRISDRPQPIEDHGEYDLQGFNEAMFSDIENKRVLKISINNVTFSEKEYISFDIFNDFFNKCVDTFNSTVNIGHYTRIGLRYINEIPLESTESYSNQISYLFNPLISIERINRNQSKSFDSVILDELDPGFKIRTRNTLGLNEKNEPVYIIDIDVFKDRAKIPPIEYKSFTEELHTLAITEFHENITDLLKERLRGGFIHGANE